MRVVEGIPVDRAKLRLTTSYQFTPRLSLGIEINPLDNDIGPLANWRLLDETKMRPALIVGTSSDRIGTPSGRAAYATLSKDLERATGLPIAPYAGVSFGDFEDEWYGIGGLSIRRGDRWNTTSLWDGVNLHHMLDYRFDTVSLGLLVIEQDSEYYLGLRWGFAF